MEGEIMEASEQTEEKKSGTILTTRRVLIAVVAVGMALFHIFTAGVRPLPGVQQRTVHLAFALALIFLMYPLRTKTDESQDTKVSDEYRPLSLLDIALIGLSIFIGVYVFVEYEALSYRAGEPNFLDSACSLVAILLLLEATRRVIGWSVVIICLFCFLYLAVGAHLPKVIAHSGFGFEEVINYIFFSTEAILGSPLGVSSTVIVVFIIFGSFLTVSGAGPLFIDVGLSLFGRFRGGPAKAAIMGSCMFGMITGSQVASVTAAGVVTIPLMKRAGYQPIVAATIEALASTGGMLVPPVMGATAFIIPEMIGGTYWDVCKAALIPGLLFYVSVYMIIELQAAKYGLRGLSKEQVPRLFDVVLRRGYMIIPIFVLILGIVKMGFSTSKAGFWAIISCIVISLIRKETIMTPKKIFMAMERGAKGSLIVAICCASAGIITGTIDFTGIGMRFSNVLLIVAGGNVLLLLFLTMIASLILGLPLPPVTCYLILAVLAAPALVKAGVTPMAAHLFVFFFGVLGSISPPVAPVSFAAAGLAGTDPVKTTNRTFLYSLPSFLVPYLYVYTNELLLMGSPAMIVFRILTAFVGLSCMAVTFHGYLFRSVGWPERLAFLLGGFALVYPSYISTGLGTVLLAILVGRQILKTKTEKPAELRAGGPL
jgi:TRAP transporter 4TM/12TM fusion protein